MKKRTAVHKDKQVIKMKSKSRATFLGMVSGKNSEAALKTARVVYETYRVTKVLFDGVVTGYSEKFRAPYSRRNYRVYGIPKRKLPGETLTIEEDRMGNITITSNQDPGSVFLQFQGDKELIYDLLRKGERNDLDNGWKVQIKGNEPRASIIGELWDAQNGIR